MEYIIMIIFGIFVGMATAAYMFIDEIDRKENRINNLIQDNVEVEEANKELRYDNAELRNLINKVVDIMNRKDIIFVDKYDKIKELLTDANQEK